ncbi:MAG: tetratricopeptide repeat protein [Deltaproteobacteria bacterium]|nr:tetratricopeptide repeat protein [Deltaproteobacteria bacterium]
MKRKSMFKSVLRPTRTAFICICVATAVVGCKKNEPSFAGNDNKQQALPRGTGDYQKIIKDAYKLKRTGYNGDALALFEKAIQQVKPGSDVYASALDDQASVLVRMGKYDKAETLYTEALKILEGHYNDSMLIQGVKERLLVLKTLKKKNIICKEPPTPDPAEKLPYFPNVVEYQQAMGTLTRELAKCHDSPVIEAMSTRVVATGDGKLVYAYAKKNKFTGTDVEKCVIQKLETLLPKTALPKFSACFRGFTYPYMLGNHPPAKDNKNASVANDSEAGNGNIPADNQSQGSPPKKDSALTGAQKLLTAFTTNTVDDAMPFFFPAEAFNVVKDSPNPGRYHNKLLEWYKEDFQQERARFKDMGWKVDDIELGSCNWKAPGTEANKVAYWSCTRNIVSASNGDKKRRFEIQVLINWGKDWYITHLGPIRKN